MEGSWDQETSISVSGCGATGVTCQWRVGEELYVVSVCLGLGQGCDVPHCRTAQRRGYGMSMWREEGLHSMSG